MQTRPRHTVVILPDNTSLEVSYFCTDIKLNEQDKVKFVDLVVQLHDCHCSYKIDKSIVNNTRSLENLIHKTVINAKGHLC
jgi:hypothetical protein